MSRAVVARKEAPVERQQEDIQSEEPLDQRGRKKESEEERETWEQTKQEGN